MSNRTRRDIMSAHAKHPHYCSCLRVVFGNGGQAGHAYMHERRGDGHRFVVPDEWARLAKEKADAS